MKRRRGDSTSRLRATSFRAREGSRPPVRGMRSLPARLLHWRASRASRARRARPARPARRAHRARPAHRASHARPACPARPARRANRARPASRASPARPPARPSHLQHNCAASHARAHFEGWIASRRPCRRVLHYNSLPGGHDPVQAPVEAAPRRGRSEQQGGRQRRGCARDAAEAVLLGGLLRGPQASSEDAG